VHRFPVAIITRDISGNTNWTAELARRHIGVYAVECIKTVPIDLTEEIAGIIQQVHRFDWIVFTSAAAVRFFAELAARSGVTARALTSVRIAAVGNRTADQIKALGLVVSFTPSKQDARTLGRELKPVKGLRLLLPKASLTPPELVIILTKRLAEVTELPIYQTIPIIERDPQLNQLIASHQVETVVFASPSAVAGFVGRTHDLTLPVICQLRTVAIGPSTSDALIQAGFSNVTQTRSPTIESVIELL
jgi:uroporphyrinogen-III synthase